MGSGQLAVMARGSVLLHTDDEVIHGRLSRITTSGFVMSSLDQTSRRGSACDVSVRLDGCAGTWLYLRGRIAPMRPQSLTTTVHCDSHELREQLRNKPDEDAATVMVVDRVTDRANSIALALRSHGCIVIVVKTPLDALTYLDDGHADLPLVVVGTTMPPSIGDELELHLLVEHPESLVLRSAELGDDPRFDFDSSPLAQQVETLWTLLQSRIRATGARRVSDRLLLARDW